MASGTAEGNPAQAVAATAEAPAPVSSLPPPTQDLAARAAKANSAAAIRAIIKEGKQQVPLPPPEKAAEPTPAAPEPEAEVAPAGEETPAAETEVPAEGAAEAPAEPEGDEAEETEDGGDGPVTPITSKRAHLRLAQDDKVGRQAAALMKRNRDMGMEEAVAKARNMLGIKEPASPATPEAPAPKSDLPQTIDAVDTEIDRLDADREKALTELRFEDVAKIDRTTRKLDRHRLQLKEDGQRHQAEQAASYDRQFAASETKATELYAFASDPESPGAKRMLEIEATLKSNGDPLYNSPDKPLRVAQMVAAEMAIAPRKKGAPAAPAKAAVPPAVPAQKKGILPGGSSRTTPPTQTPESVVTSKVADVKNPHQFRAYMKTLGVKV